MLKSFIKKEAVLCAASAAALASAFFVHPSARYIEYIDMRVLALLFSLMLTVAGAKKAGAFELVTDALFSFAKSTRSLAFVLVGACFFSSMLITNDVALITFVPLAVMIFSNGAHGLLIPVTVLMTVAANLGSMLTPIGNPQNLYLYSAFKMPADRFFGAMAMPCAVSAALLIISVLLQKRLPLAAEKSAARHSIRALLPWLLLFFVCILCVGRALHYAVMLLIVSAAVLLLDRDIFKSVDYSLLLTFIAFFIFVGNIQRMPQISSVLQSAVSHNELAAGVLLSQVISNVPAAVLLSGFCDDPYALLVGVNIGGLGTPIASMASLISYKQYAVLKDARRGAYMTAFLSVNAAFLAVLFMICALTAR